MRVCANTHPGGVLITHPGGARARADHDPCAHQPGPQYILLTPIAVPVQSGDVCSREVASHCKEGSPGDQESFTWYKDSEVILPINRHYWPSMDDIIVDEVDLFPTGPSRQ